MTYQNQAKVDNHKTKSNIMITYSIIQKSQLEGASRLDAEYYQPEYLKVLEDVSKLQPKKLKEIAEKVFSGPFGSTLKSESYQQEGVPFIRIGDIVDIFIEKENLVYISEDEHKRIYSTHLNSGDIVLSKIGTVGRLSVINEEFREVNISENNIGVRLQNLSPPARSFVLFFLLCEYGQKQISRKASGNIQLKLNVKDVEDIVIPFSEKIDYEIFGELYKQILKAKEDFENLYSQAENFLLEELGLKDFEEEAGLFSIVNFSDLKTADRMDAEYFQSTFEKIKSKLKDYKIEKLGNLASVQKGFEPGSEAYQEEGKLFIRVSSLSKDGITDKDQKYLSDKLYNELKSDFQPKVGEILLTKDATPGVAYVLKEPIEGVISGGILRLSVNKEIDPEYLALCINSMIGQSQVERDAGGSIIKHWKPSQVQEMVIPVLLKAKQEKIADLVKQSHEARKKAKELLEEAKHKVEKLIEN